MQVANCTTPANYFHILRRQLKRNFRKPLVLMTPKSLLRHKKCVSDLTDFESGSSFHRVLWDNMDARLEGGLQKPEDIRRVVLCSGKVYFDLLDARQEAGLDDVYIMRVEQLYPFPHKAFTAELKKFPNATEVVWCQDEPQNQGAWFFVQHHLHQVKNLSTVM